MATFIDMTDKALAADSLASSLRAGMAQMDANGHLEGMDAVGFEYAAERFFDLVAFDMDSIDFEYVRRTVRSVADAAAWFLRNPLWSDRLLIED